MVSCAIWAHWQPAERGFRCIGFDRRGHGRSDQPGDGYDFDTFADDTARLVNELDLSGLTMISHSMAAGEIIRYLTRQGSSRIARAIFLAPMTPMLLQTKSNPDGIPRANFEALWAQWKSDYPKWVEDATAPFFVQETSRAMMRWMGNVLQSPLPVNLACSRMMVEADFRDEMQKIALPTLIVHGDRDRSAPIEVTGIPSAELISGSRFLTYKGASHGLMYTHMDQLHADILQFMRETR